MALMRENTIGIKRIGSSVRLSTNPFSKLKYYLNCVAHSFDICDELENFIDYYRDGPLTLGEKKAIVTLAYLFSPDELSGKCWFPNEDMEMNNQFYELNHVQSSVLIAENILIGAQNRRVAKVMFFKKCWLEANWAQPILLAVDDLQNEERPKIAPKPKPVQNTTKTSYCTIL